MKRKKEKKMHTISPKLGLALWLSSISIAYMSLNLQATESAEIPSYILNRNE